MKKIILILFIFYALSSMAQDRKPDSVFKINGDTLQVFVINLSEYDATYSFPNESITYTVTKNVIYKIKFGSGRIEKITDPIIVKNEDDWEKVKITTIPSEIKGLVSIGSVKAMGNVGFGLKNAITFDNKIEEKLKRQAADMGSHIIFLETKNSQANGATIITGVAFGYKKTPIDSSIQKFDSLENSTIKKYQKNRNLKHNPYKKQEDIKKGDYVLYFDNIDEPDLALVIEIPEENSKSKKIKIKIYTATSDVIIKNVKYADLEKIEDNQ